MATEVFISPPDEAIGAAAHCAIHGTRVHDKTRPLVAGMQAPAFALRAAPHRLIAPTDYLGQPLVLIFYIADWHPVCSAQLTLYQELLPDLRHLGAEVIGISADHLWSHAAFARSQGLTFPLLSDNLPRGKVARSYGVYTPRTGACCRAVFVIDGSGIIRWSAAFPEAINPGADGIFTALETLTAANGPLYTGGAQASCSTPR